MADSEDSCDERDSGGEFDTPDLDEVLEKNQDLDQLASVDGRPLLPKDVLRGIEDILKGRTASVDEIGAVLKD